MDETKHKITQITFTIPAELRIGETARKILEAKFAHPDWTQQKIAEEVHTSPTRVNQVLNHPRILAVMPMIAKQKISLMVPKALQAYQEVIDQNINLAVKEKAANRVLTDKGVLDGPKVTIDGEIRLRDVRELRKIVENAVKLPENAIEAEIVDDKSL